MYETIRSFPHQFLVGYRRLDPRESFPDWRKIGAVILVGMGGSALPGDLLNDYLGGKGILILRDYRLGNFLDRGNLALVSSYSGNTEETLSVFEETLSHEVPCLVLTHGGLLKEKALAKRVPLVEIPACIQPRCAAGFFFGAILGILERIGKIPPQRKVLGELATFLGRERDREERVGRELGRHLTNRVPIVYGPSELAGTCRVIKIKFNENAKVPCFWNVFPELNHNEMVGWTQSTMKPAILCLISQFMHPRVSRRMEVMQELLSERFPFHRIELRGENRLQEIFDAQAIADYASYTLAVKYGIDPAAVDMVEEFKKRL